MIRQNMQGMQQQIEQFAGERIAENMSEQPPADSADNLMNRPFEALSDSDKKVLQTGSETTGSDVADAYRVAAEARQERTDSTPRQRSAPI